MSVPASPAKTTPARLAGAGRFVAFVVIYLALEWLSDVRDHGGLPTAAWSPGLGILFAAMVRGDAVAGLALFAGAFIAEFVFVNNTLGIELTIAVAVIIAAVYALMAWLARALDLDTRIERVHDVAMLLSAALGGALLVGVLLTALLTISEVMAPADGVRVSVPIFVGDMIGLAVVAPLALRFTGRDARARIFDQSFLAGVASAALLAVVFVWLMLKDSDPPPYESFYLLFVPIVFVALRNGLDGVCITLAATQLALVAGLNQFGYDTQAYAQFQTLMGVLTGVGLLAGAVSSERDAASRAAATARAQLKQKESEAARAERFQVVTGLASALAHEINQPMTAARAFARTAQVLSEQEGADPARVRDYVGRSIEQIDAAAEILRSMREFMRRGDGGATLARPADILNDALLLVRPLAAQHKVRLVSDAENAPAILCDRVQIQQVLVNLIRNAVDAITGACQTDGVVAISIRATPDKRVEFSVRDNGPGVDPDFASKVFEPLATTKPGGLGLGLAISADIVAAHGGRIWLETSGPGATEFRFWLSLAMRGNADASEDGERGQP